MFCKMWWMEYYIIWNVCVRVCVSTCMHACVHVEVTDAGNCSFPLQYIYSSMFISGWINMWMKGIVFLLCPSLLSWTDNGITLQRSFSLYPVLLWPPPAFVHIHHNNSPDPNLHHQASPRFLFPSGERLNLDQNEKLICTQQLMAILIRYNYSATFRLIFLFHRQTPF